MVKESQAAFEKGTRAFALKMNCYADLSLEDFAEGYTGQGQLAGEGEAGGGSAHVIDPDIVPVTQRIVRAKKTHNKHAYNYREPEYPTELDWSKKGKKT